MVADDVADDASEQHLAALTFGMQRNTFISSSRRRVRPRAARRDHFIDDADDRGVHRPVLAFGGVARGTAGDDQHGFAESGIHRVHGDQIAGFVGAFRGNGFTTRSFLPSRRGSLRVETTVPTMRARIIVATVHAFRPQEKTESRNESIAATPASLQQRAPIAPRMVRPREPRAAAAFTVRRPRRLADGQHVLERLMRPRDDVHGDQFADAPRRGGAGVGGGFHGGHVAAHHRGDIARADFFPADERDLGRLDHRVRGLNHRDQSAGLDHAECFAHASSSERTPAVWFGYRRTCKFAAKSGRKNNPARVSGARDLCALLLRSVLPDLARHRDAAPPSGGVAMLPDTPGRPGRA